MHVGAEGLQAQDQQRIEVVVVGIALGRRPDDRAGGSALMVIVENLWQPLVVEDAVDVLGLCLRGCKEVAIVVVADVLLVETRQPGGGSPLRLRIPHVPVGHQLVAIGVGVDEQDDAVVEKALGLGIGPRDHLVDHFRRAAARPASRWRAARRRSRRPRVLPRPARGLRFRRRPRLAPVVSRSP